MTKQRITTDILVIGSGIAGLTFAIKSARSFPDKTIAILTKATDEKETNTRYAQGGVAAAWDTQNDSVEQHIEDTLKTGDGLCDETIVKLVIQGGPERLKELLEWNIQLDKTDDTGDFALAREGGHSVSRILYHKDTTGAELMRGLTEKALGFSNIKFLPDMFALDLITQHHLGKTISRESQDVQCYGCYALNQTTDCIQTILSRITVVCAGGIGQAYQSTTNPVIATGDGIAMAYRAKAKVADMEFVQFHPTALYEPERNGPNFLISEAVRGAGAELKTPTGKEFMSRYDERGSLAPRDSVARAIDAEMKTHGYDFMMLDCRNIEAAEFESHFPNILSYCQNAGYDPLKKMIPVVPAAHYVCGGIATDANAKTSIERLYAIGECACTGLHGANRLASNSLLECMVFAHQAHADMCQSLNQYDIQTDVPDWNASGTSAPEEMILITAARQELQEVMSRYVGIVRSNLRLNRAFDRLRRLYEETEQLYQTTTLSVPLAELRNLITIGYLTTRAAMARQENCGLHYNADNEG